MASDPITYLVATDPTMGDEREVMLVPSQKDPHRGHASEEFTIPAGWIVSLKMVTDDDSSGFQI